jgi:hypothetical protein
VLEHGDGPKDRKFDKALDSFSTAWTAKDPLGLGGLAPACRVFVALNSETGLKFIYL